MANTDCPRTFKQASRTASSYPAGSPAGFELRLVGIGASNGISTEEDGPVQSEDVVVPLGVEIHREASGIPTLVRILAAQSDGGEVYQSRRLLTDLLKEVCFLPSL